MSEPEYLFRMFLNFGKSEPKCSYKLDSYKTRVVVPKKLPKLC